MIRLARVLLGLLLIAAAAWNVVGAVDRATGGDEIAGSRVKPGGKRVVELTPGKLQVWSETGPRGQHWSANTCDGTRNGSPINEPVVRHMATAGLRLAPEGGGRPAKLVKATCWRVSGSTGNRISAAAFRVERAGRYQFSAASGRVGAGESYFLSSSGTPIPRVAFAAALFLVGLFSIFGGTGRKRRRALRKQAQAAIPPPRPQFLQQP